MDIKDVKDGMRRVDVKGGITGLSETRDVYLRDGTKAKVADYTLTDQSGSIKLTLWNEQIDKVKDGSQVEIGNGYVANFRGELSLNVGRYGTLKVPDEGAPTAIG